MTEGSAVHILVADVVVDAKKASVACEERKKEQNMDKKRRHGEAAAS